MRYDIIKKIDVEVWRGEEKWGDIDTTPQILLNAITEEVGEVAHAINHEEGVERTQQEIAEAMGVLTRLYIMVEQENNVPR